MKTGIVIATMLAMGQGAALAGNVDQAIAVITNAMPSDWKVAYIEQVKPSWARSNEKCTEMLLYGPRLQGFAYYGKPDMKGPCIAERRYVNEGLLVWVTPEGYRSGWNVFNKVINLFSPFAVNRPARIGDDQGSHVYVCQSTYIAPENEHLHKESPQGTRSAGPIAPSNGYSWLKWKSDLTVAIKK